MGLSTSRDVFCHRTHQAVRDLEGVMKLVDNCLAGGRGVVGLGMRLRELLSRCREYNIKISRKKFDLGSRLSFGGFVIDATSGELKICPDPARLEAIKMMKSPDSKETSERVPWLGQDS